MQIQAWLRKYVALAVAVGLMAALPGRLAADEFTSAKKRKKAGKSESEVDRTAAIAGKSVSTTPLKRVLNASREIDRLIEAGYKKHKVKPNPPVSDEVFVRRIHLAIIGRIPTRQEALAFLESKDPQRRSKLIDKLLDSEGFVSHYYNYWADLLRIRSRMRYAPAQPYIDFVKQSLRDNKPYDQLVRDLLTSEGYTWDNGAAGYYLRDTGMPLDNMSNTSRVFLGTQLVCAQCHNHPFDTWTQKQYYQLAAFTYGTQTRDRRHPKYMAVRKMLREGEIDREVMRSANRVMQALAFRVHETNRPLRLPKDYQYDDAKPRSVIKPATILGQPINLKKGQSPRQAYADWMTSPKNPRFTHVIANRLWKRVMGIGLIEPVDDFKEATNPQLMGFLAQEMAHLKYDVKQYLRVLFNTKTYQREVSDKEVLASDTYHFPGPVLTRMTAEQLWDSFMVLMVPHLDERKGMVTYNRYANGPELVKKGLKEILTMAEEQAKTRRLQVKYRELTAGLQKQIRVAQRTNDREKMTKLRNKMNEIRTQVYGPAGDRRLQRQRRQNRNRRRDPDPRWTGFSRDMVRASEVESPARPGHFLRQFGQSDRETIENASSEANVPQILTLLNGPIYFQLTRNNSTLAKDLAAASSRDEKIDVMFVSILSRRPTSRERKLVAQTLEEGGRKGVSDVIWALLNTRQFAFVQ